MTNFGETQVRANLEALHELKPQMQELKQTVGSYISTVQDAILKRRTDYQSKLTQLRSSENQLKTEIEMNKKLREQLLEELSNEMRNRDQSSVKLDEMKIQQESLEKEKANFTKQLDEIEVQISDKLRQINEQRDIMKNQTTLVNDKLYQFEQLLGLRIEHSSKLEEDEEGEEEETDMITFIFKNIDPKDFSHEASFILDPVKVHIVHSDPPLPEDVLKQATDMFLETKEISYLWKFMRSAFRETLVSLQR